MSMQPNGVLLTLGVRCSARARTAALGVAGDDSRELSERSRPAPRAPAGRACSGAAPPPAARSASPCSHGAAASRLPRPCGAPPAPAASASSAQHAPAPARSFAKRASDAAGGSATRILRMDVRVGQAAGARRQRRHERRGAPRPVPRSAPRSGRCHSPAATAQRARALPAGVTDTHHTARHVVQPTGTVGHASARARGRTAAGA